MVQVAGGCSMSYQMDSVFARQSAADPDTTGSLKPTPAPAPPNLAAAGPAVSEALGRNGASASVPWEDPSTGARGTVTPLSNAYTQDGSTCRDFLASYVRNGAEAWLQGEACRGFQGRWEIRSMRPWKRT